MIMQVADDFYYCMGPHTHFWGGKNKCVVEVLVHELASYRGLIVIGAGKREARH